MGEKNARPTKSTSLLSPRRILNRRSLAGRALSDRRRQRVAETLEERQLLAVGPQLISIQPNSGDVLSTGTVRDVAPQDLTLVFDALQVIDPSTLDGIRVTRAGFDGTFDGVTDVLVEPGYIGVDEDSPNEVVVRFAESLPDDLYRISVFGIDDASAGITALRNVEGDPFQPRVPGADRTTVTFELNLGAQVLAVVPQPVSRQEDGSLSQDRRVIEVYFNNDDLSPAAAQNPAFYRLMRTQETVANTDDNIILPSSVVYDAAADKATLTFDTALETSGTYRLRIGNDDALPAVPTFEDVTDDPGSSFATATNLGTMDSALVVTQAIDPENYVLNYPGDESEPGHREIGEVQSHFLGSVWVNAVVSEEQAAQFNPDATGNDLYNGVLTLPYNFKQIYGWDPNGVPLMNLITEAQKELTREIFDSYAYYLGVNFVETASDGFTIVTGDIRALDPTAVPGPSGVLGIAGDAQVNNPNPDPANPVVWPTAVMDVQENWNSIGRGDWFETTMHEIGHLLGLGHTDDLPAPTLMDHDPTQTYTVPPEPLFPGPHDIVHGRNVHRPESHDIDIYRFTLQSAGQFTAEIIAERREDSSPLDSVITLYKQTSSGPQLISRNDDYYSEDSFVDLNLQAGIYFLAVSSTGNTAFDPTVENTGANGTTQGGYDLRFDFLPRFDNFIVDSTGVPLDGDADGTPGGDYNYWFQVADEASTVFVDKTAAAGGNGAIGTPYNNLREALSSPRLASGGILRVVGNGGADGDVATLGDNQAYELGFQNGRALSDGLTLRLPRDVTMMVDAGAIFKLWETNIHVGSSSVGIDRSGSALQLLGRPGEPVILTSYDDQSIGVDTNPRITTPDPGDWGGIIFQNDTDRAEGRFDYEKIGAFMNVVNQTQLFYGGGNVVTDSIQQVINPIHMVDSRPMLSYNLVRFSADAAFSANPDSFEETNFSAPDSLGINYQETPFTPDYQRIGPDIRGNRLVDNSVNGIFVRIDTPAAEQLERMTVTGRWDDTDTVHVVTENLVLDGRAGGALVDPLTGIRQARTDAQLRIDPGIVVKLSGARIEAEVGTQLLAEGDVGNRVIITSLEDTRYGAGGTFETSDIAGEGATDPAAPGDWSGIYIAPTARASIDQAVLAYGGGLSRVEGSFAGFNTIEVHQGDLRVTNTVIEESANGRGGQASLTRGGRLPNGEGAIYVLGSQPVILNNVIKGTRGAEAAAISIDANSLNHEIVTDIGRSTGMIDAEGIINNQGPLVRFNRLGGNRINGMLVRGGTLVTESVWDDTDIVHVLFQEIVVPNLHTHGGLRLESSPSESLVIKLRGRDAGFRASGRLLDIDDRVGGSLQVVGQPGFPVVMTSFEDDEVGAGFDPTGRPQNDTDGPGRDLPVNPPGSFQIDINYGPIISGFPQYIEAIETAVHFWERWVEDPIQVVLDMEIDPGLRDSGTLGAATSEPVTFDWDEVRDAMVADGRSHEIDTLLDLPAFDDTSFVVPIDENNPFSINRTVTVNRALAKALGLDVTGSGSTSIYDPADTRDGSIVFAPNPWQVAADGTPGMFDFNRFDLMSMEDTDFLGVVIHEIGHTLGFTSGVDTVDAALNAANGQRNISLEPLDMFRLAPGEGARQGLANAPRVVDPGRDQVFYDGGIYDPFAITQVPNLDLGDIPLSTGADNGDGGQASHWKDLPITIGILDPTVAAGEGWMTEADFTAFDLIGWDVVGGGVAGDWRGITLEQYSNDRNLATITERENPELAAPGNNFEPAAAEFLGELGRRENESDENLRLGFEVHGTISGTRDVDVYSFEAKGGTEIWLDIDATTRSLDTVIELIDANQNVLARSNDSYYENLPSNHPQAEDVFAASGVFVASLQKTPYYTQDYYSQNLGDAGMRLVLPGPRGLVATYHVRIRSAGEDLSQVNGGLTQGRYQLQVRLGEVDEHPGSSVEFANIRYATDGVRVRGLPQHSPLIGETAEDVWQGGSPADNNNMPALGELYINDPDLEIVETITDNSRVKFRFFGEEYDLDVAGNIAGILDRFEEAQYLGNILNSDRGAISVGGTISADTDTHDFYRFDVQFEAIQQPGGNTAELTFDLDYADGLARLDAAIAIYRIERVLTNQPDGPEVESVELVYYSADANTPDDLPAPFQGTDLDDLSRGSVGRGDPYIGPVALAEGEYLMAIHSPTVAPAELLQYSVELAPNPFYRLEPIDSVGRIAEDRMDEIPVTDEGVITPFDPPQVPLLLSQGDSVVPYTLADVQLFVSNANAVFTADPFTGGREVFYGSIFGDGLDSASMQDFALRDNPTFDAGLEPGDGDDPLVVAEATRTQRLMTFLDLGAPITTDETTGHYAHLDIADTNSAIDEVTTTLNGEDLILTFIPDPEAEDPLTAGTVATDEETGGGGLIYDAMTFSEADGYDFGWAIARRFDGSVENILVRFDGETGVAVPADAHPLGDEENFPIPNPIPPDIVLPDPLPANLDPPFPNAGFNVLEHGVLDTTKDDGTEGGRITGMAFLGSQLIGVSDEGGVYSITFPGPGARARYLGTLYEPNEDPTAELDPIPFSGLTAGPADVEGGLYSSMLFGIDSNGELYAFSIGDDNPDTPELDRAVLEPVFANATLSISTGVRGATGVEFGLLDENLWHITETRGDDVGHGRISPAPQGGGASFYFGEDVNAGGGDGRRYDFLGDAHGSLVTQPFSLEGYADSHEPHIYFTYFMSTEQASLTPGAGGGGLPAARDTFRVFVTDDSRDDGRGQWHLVASNQPGEVGPGALDVNPDDDILIDVQPLWDNTWQDVPFVGEEVLNPGPNGERDPYPFLDGLTPYDGAGPDWLDETEGVWRQARIPLEAFAGSDSLRIRFDFSTAGSFDVGNKGGVELRAISGDRIQDGDTVVIDDVPFEFDRGYSLVVRGGAHLTEGETFEVTDADGNTVTFEMDNDGSTAAGNEPIPYTANDNATIVTDAIETALLAAMPGVTVHRDGNNLNLEGAVSLTLSADAGLQTAGEPGVADGAVPVVITAGMSSAEVAEAMVQPLADTFANGRTEAIKFFENIITLFDLSVDDQGPLGLTSVLPGDSEGNFYTPLRGQNYQPPVDLGPDADPDALLLANPYNDARLYVPQIPQQDGGSEITEPEDWFTVPYEGVFVDDLIVGFAAFGELAADLRPDDPLDVEVFDIWKGAMINTAPAGAVISTGAYQVEMRRASDYAAGLTPFRSFDPQDRLARATTLDVPAGTEISDGEVFNVGDGVTTVTFEFEDTELANGVTAGRIAVPFSTADPDTTVAEAVRDAINSVFLAGDLDVTAATSNGAAVGSAATTSRVNLFGTSVVAEMPSNPLFVIAFDEEGASNRFRDQGQIMIQNNRITHSSLHGIVVEDAPRDFPTYDFTLPDPHSQGVTGDYAPSLGAVRNLREENLNSIAPGIVIANNILAFGGEGGISYAGDAGGEAIIGPVAGQVGRSEVWDDGRHFLLHITDNNGRSEVFEFGQAAHPFLPLVPEQNRIIWETSQGCAVHTPLQPNECSPRYNPIALDTTEALWIAIQGSALDVTVRRTRGDEIYVDGALQILSAIVTGTPDSVTFVADEWFYPFHNRSTQSANSFGRIVNNTIVGNGGRLVGSTNYQADDFDDVGIQLSDFSAATLLNNVVVNFDRGIVVDNTSQQSIVGATLYQGNRDKVVNFDIGDFPIELSDDAPLFVDREAGNFYPAPFSRVIDSSVDSLEDRPDLVIVKEPHDIARSPILVPDFDVLGQLRADDPSVEPPDGFGNNVFKDRGAVDRIDFQGPIAQFVVPLDNDTAGTDQNPAQDEVRIEDTTLTEFVVQLVDLGEVNLPTGTGIDDSSVLSESVILRRDGVALEPGVDYRFDYQATTNQIVLTPQAGVWLDGFTYEIELVNRDRIVIAAEDQLADAEIFSIVDSSGTLQRFEFDLGSVLEVPQPLTLQVPVGSTGLSAVADEEIFTVSTGNQLVTFEFDNNGFFTEGRVRVPFNASSTPDQVAANIATAIRSTQLTLSPVALGDGLVHIGGRITTVVDTAVSALEQFGNPGVFADGHRMEIQNGATTVEFVFCDELALETVGFQGICETIETGGQNGTFRPIPGRVPVRFDSRATRRELAISVVDAVNDAGLDLNAFLGPDGTISLGTEPGIAVNTDTSNLAIVGDVGTISGAIPVVVRPREGQTEQEVSEVLRAAVDLSALDASTLIDEFGQLVIYGASDANGIEFAFAPGIRDIAGNLLPTNQNFDPFRTLLTVDLPGALDFGDAPTSYATLLSDNGARHVVVPNAHLGATNSAELDGQEVDDSDDGVIFTSQLAPGSNSPLVITTTAAGFIDAWIDIDGDGAFDEVRDRVMDSVPVTAGANALRLNVPDDAQVGTTWARFRYSTAGGLSSAGRAVDGEVEDYEITIDNIARPVATNDSYDAVEDETLIIGAASGLLANDVASVDGQTITAELRTMPANGTVTLNSDGSFVYQPDPDYFGIDSFQYVASSDILSSTVATVTIDIESAPDAPFAADDVMVTSEDVPLQFDVVANDRDPDGALVRSSLRITTEPTHGTVVVNTEGLATYTPDPDFNGTDSFQYVISDTDGVESNEATVNVTVTPVNDAPIANDDVLFLRQDMIATFDLLANDIDIDGELDPESLVITLSPKSGTIISNDDGTIDYTPDFGFVGVDRFRYIVSDDMGTTSNQGFVTVTVSNENLLPVAQDDSAQTSRGQSVLIDVAANDTDADGDVVPGSIALASPPNHGQVTFNDNGTVLYEPNANFVGTDQFTYTIRDEVNDVSEPATVTVEVIETSPPWQNQANPFDVNDNGVVEPLDALLVINELNKNGPRPLESPPVDTEPTQPPPYLDVTGDDFLTPLDALRVINRLNDSTAPVAAVVAVGFAATQDIGAALDIVPKFTLENSKPALVEQALIATESEGRARELSDIEWTSNFDQSRKFTVEPAEETDVALEMLLDDDDLFDV